MYIILAAVVIVLDQITKFFIRKMPMDSEYNIIGDFLRIVHVENSGAAFGLLEGNRRFLLLVPAVVVIGILIVMAREKGTGLRFTLERISLALIASGGVGNLIDRMMFGHVTDMISFSIFPPVFNVADIAVTCGCGLLILSLLIGNRDAAEDAGGSGGHNEAAENAMQSAADGSVMQSAGADDDSDDRKEVQK